MANPQISFVIPIKDEAPSLEQLVKEINQVFLHTEKTYEIIFIDDGSTDNSFKLLKKLAKSQKNISAYRLRGNFGKSIALNVGFSKVKGNIIFTLDGDLQDNPKEIPQFLKKIEQGYDLVSGWKKKRHDPTNKVISSKIINLLARLLSGTTLHDINCGFKAYKKEVINNLKLYGDLYRFIPLFAAKRNFRVGEIEVEHRARVYGKSKYGWSRGLKGGLDLITAIFLTTYLKRPGHFFGSLGVLFFIPGFLIGIYITYLRITTGGIDYRYPLLFLGALLMIVGVQFISTGLLAEMINSNQPEQNLDSIIVDSI